MECPDCGLPVIIKDGTIQPHLRPDTLKQCDATPKAEAPHKTPNEPSTPAAKKDPPTKAPSRPASNTKTTKH